MITQQQLKECLKLLGDAYGYDFSVFNNPMIFKIWFDFFSERFRTSEKFSQMACNYIATSSFFPRSPKELYESWNNEIASIPPNNKLALPSAELNAESLTPEQMTENYSRMILIINVIMGKAKALSADKKDELIAVMRAMHIDDLKDFVSNYRNRAQCP